MDRVMGTRNAQLKRHLDNYRDKMASGMAIKKIPAGRTDGQNESGGTRSGRADAFPSVLEESRLDNSLPYLPAVFTLPSNVDLCVDTLQESDRDAARQAYIMVLNASQRGENIGLDEFPTEQSFTDLLQDADAFTGADVRDGALKALIVIAPSKYSRTADPVYADGYILLDPALQKLDTYRMMLNISLQFVRDLDYEGFLVNAFANHTKSVLALRGEGFMVVGCIPSSGYIKDHGWTESLMLYKELTNDPLKVIPMKSAGSVNIRLNLARAPLADTGKNHALDAKSETSKFIPTKQNNANFDSGMTLKSRLSFFPLSYNLIGKNIVLDYVKDSECQEVFDLYMSSASQGQGYGEDEFTDLQDFKSSFVDNAHAVIGRDPTSGKIVVSFSITPSPYCRSSSPPLADGYMLVDPNFRGKGIGIQVMRLMLRLTKEVGYQGCMADTFITNKAMYKMMISTGFTPVAYLPKCANVKDAGWTDVVFMYRQLIDNLSTLAKL